MALAPDETGISACQDMSRSPVSGRPRNCRGAVMSSTSQPTRATGTAMGTNENIVTCTPLGAAREAMIRLELVPMSVADPASVVAWAIGYSTLRAGTPDWCSSSCEVGMSMATIGVVLMSDETNPTGGMSRRSACRGELTPASSR